MSTEANTLGWEHAKHALQMIGQLGLNAGQLTLLLQCMSPVTQMIKDGSITSVKELKKILSPNLPVWGYFEYIHPTNENDVLDADEFIQAADAMAKKEGKKIMGDQEYLFYSKPENWNLLPHDPQIKEIVFCGSSVDQFVSLICRHNEGWLPKRTWRSNCYFGKERHKSHVAAVMCAD